MNEDYFELCKYDTNTYNTIVEQFWKQKRLILRNFALFHAKMAGP